MDLAITSARGARNVTVTSGSDGTFKVDLIPGEYVITTARIFGPPLLRNDTLVRVVAGSYVDVVLHADTGIR